MAGGGASPGRPRARGAACRTRRRDHSARARRPCRARRRSVRRDQGVDLRFRHHRLRRPRRSDRDRDEASDGNVRDDRGEAVLDAAAAIAAAHAHEWGALVAGLIRLTGDWDLAEECAQDAFVQAWERWPTDGVPERPGAWLTTTARNRALDRLRRASLETTKNEQALVMDRVADGAVAVTTAMDDQLCLIFTCCHPALAMDARVALTLRTVAGLRTAEIARAFVVSENTMRQRLFRAKAKIRDAAIPFRVPGPDQLAVRLDDVLAVLYFVFNEGYHASEGDDVLRVDVAHEAIRLATLLSELMPEEPEVDGLRVLMELHDARRDTRVDRDGAIVPLEDQDRTRWDHDRID